MRPFFTAGLACLLLALIGAPAASAELVPICWDGPSSGYWTDPFNWAGDVVPGPGDIAVLNSDIPGLCSSPTTVTLSGASASVGLIAQGAHTTIVIEGGGMGHGLTLTDKAGPFPIHVLGDVQVRGGGHLTVAPTSVVDAGGTITLGDKDAVNGNLKIEGSLRTVTSQFDVVEPSGGGSVSIASGASLTYGAGTTGVLNARLDNDGAIKLQEQGAFFADLRISTSTGQAASEGVFDVSAKSQLTLSPTKGTSMPITGIVTGLGTVEVAGSTGPPGDPGTVTLAAAATLDVAKLVIGPGSALELAAGGTASADTLVMGAGDGQRSGGGTLTATTAQIHGGHFSGGLTRITGQAAISGAATTPVVHDGATLQTQGPTAWATGDVTLGGTPAPGHEGEGAAWQNAGTLTVGGSPSLLAGSDNGVLRNLAAGSLIRDSPGAMFATTRIENAGTITLLAGSIGTTTPLPVDAADLVQTGGVTSVAAGAALGMDVKLGDGALAGGTLTGAGTVRSLVNSSGTVAPGASPATLSVDGEFSQGAGGTVAIDIAGSGAGEFDRLLVGEAATLGGTLAITTAAGYAPPKHTTFHIVQAKARSGGFAQLTGTQTAGSSYAAENLTDGMQLCFGCGPPGTVELTVTLSGAGAGTVTSDPAGISCGADCAQDVVAGTDMTLTAHPAAGSVFAGWSGICAGLGPCVVTMDQAREVTATFAPEPPPQPPPAGVAATPAASSSPKLQVAGIVAFPSAKGCRRSRTLRVRIRAPRGLSATQARLTINGRRARTVRGAKLRQPITLRRLPRGRVKVQLVITLSDRRVVTESRVYRICKA